MFDTFNEFDKIKRIVIRQCGPVFMGIKPAALFPLNSTDYLDCLSALLPRNISVLVVRKTKGRPLVLLYEKTMLKKTLSYSAVRWFLLDMGYPAAASLTSVFVHLKKRFAQEDFPHEVGLFLGYPVEDVSGFVRHRGQNYKLSGYWKVYGDAEEAKRLFRRYDLCREYMKSMMFSNRGPSAYRYGYPSL
jgi:hypothetical protein